MPNVLRELAAGVLTKEQRIQWNMGRPPIRLTAEQSRALAGVVESVARDSGFSLPGTITEFCILCGGPHDRARCPKHKP